MYTTSDLITYAVAHNRRAADALRRTCSLGVLEYRMLSYLSDHPDGAQPIQLAKILSIGAASITQASNKLADKWLIMRELPDKPARSMAITERGLDVSYKADIALACVHEEFFSPLPPNMRAIVDIGSTAMNQASEEGNRIRDGHFFTAYEVFRAFLIFEQFLTRSTQKLNLSLTEFRILFEMDRQGGSALPGVLAEALLLAPSTIAYTAAKLERKGFVRRVLNAADKRTIALAFTQEGIAAFELALRNVESAYPANIKMSNRTEQDTYKDAAIIIVSTLRKRYNRGRRTVTP